SSGATWREVSPHWLEAVTRFHRRVAFQGNYCASMPLIRSRTLRQKRTPERCREGSLRFAEETNASQATWEDPECLQLGFPLLPEFSRTRILGSASRKPFPGLWSRDKDQSSERRPAAAF